MKSDTREHLRALAIVVFLYAIQFVLLGVPNGERLVYNRKILPVLSKVRTIHTRTVKSHFHTQNVTAPQLTAAQEAAYFEIGPLIFVSNCTNETPDSCLSMGVTLQYEPDISVVVAGRKAGLSDSAHVSTPDDANEALQFWIFNTIQWSLILLCLARCNKTPVKENSAPLMVMTILDANINFFIGHGATAWGLSWSCNSTLTTQFTVPQSIFTVLCMIYRYSFMYRWGMARYRDYVAKKMSGGEADWYKNHSWYIGFGGFMVTQLIYMLPYLIDIFWLYTTFPQDYLPNTTILASGRGYWWNLDTPQVRAVCEAAGAPCADLFINWPLGPHVSTWQFCATSNTAAKISQILEIFSCYTMVPMIYWYLWRPRVNDLRGIKYMVFGMSAPALITMPMFNSPYYATLSPGSQNALIFFTEIMPTLGMTIPTLLSFTRANRSVSELSGTSTHSLTWDDSLPSGTTPAHDDIDTISAAAPDESKVDSIDVPYLTLVTAVADNGANVITLNALVRKPKSKAGKPFVSHKVTAQQFRMIFEDPFGHLLAQKCLRKLFCMEQMLFLSQVKTFYDLCVVNYEQARAFGYQICNLYFAKDGASRLNIESSSYDKVLRLFPDYVAHKVQFVEPTIQHTDDVVAPPRLDLKAIQTEFRSVENEIALLLQHNVLPDFTRLYLPKLIDDVRQYSRKHGRIVTGTEKSARMNLCCWCNSKRVVRVRSRMTPTENASSRLSPPRELTIMVRKEPDELTLNVPHK